MVDHTLCDVSRNNEHDDDDDDEDDYARLGLRAQSSHTDTMNAKRHDVCFSFDQFVM